MAGRARAVRAVGDLVHALPPLADRWDLGPHPEEIAGQGRRGGTPRLEVSVDSTICRAHQHVAGARKKGAPGAGRTRPNGLAAEPDDHTIGRSRGGLTTKIHLAVDSSLHVLAVITAGQRTGVHRGHEPYPRASDRWRTTTRPPCSRPGRPGVLLAAHPRVPAPAADPAHHPGEAGPGRTPPPSGVGGWPPAFDREMYKRRNRVECRIGLLKQARGVATRYGKLAVRYEATVQLTLIRQAL